MLIALGIINIRHELGLFVDLFRPHLEVFGGVFQVFDALSFGRYG